MKALIGILAALMLANGNAVDTAKSVEVRVDYGVVLNEQGDGRIIVDADPYYNYINYSNVDAAAGEVVKTTSILINGEVEHRYDTVMPIFVDRYEENWVVFEIVDGNDTVMGECPSELIETDLY